MRTVKWIIISILTLFLSGIFLLWYLDRRPYMDAILWERSLEESHMEFDVPYSAEGIDYCINSLIPSQSQRSDSIICKQFPDSENMALVQSDMLYYMDYPEFSKIDFVLADSLLKIATNDTIYCVMTRFNTENPFYVIRVASYSTARTVEFYREFSSDKVETEVYDKVLWDTFNVRKTVADFHSSTAWPASIGAKIVVENDTLRSGTLYYNLFKTVQP